MVIAICHAGSTCRIPRCRMTHPDGRDEEKLLLLQTIGERGNFVSDMAQFERETEQEALRQTWFPDHMDCACCHGYVYGCIDATCILLGCCGCACGPTIKEWNESIESNDSEQSQQYPQTAIEWLEGGTIQLVTDSITEAVETIRQQQQS